jgi:hypothetical protein
MRRPLLARPHILGFLFFAVILASLKPVALSADRQITDPRSWADGIVRLFAMGDIKELTDELFESSGGHITREKISASVSVLAPMVAQSGPFRASDLIAEKRYGQSIAAFWYYVRFEKQEMFMHLRLFKRGTYWQVNNFRFNTDFDKIDAP